MLTEIQTSDGRFSITKTADAIDQYRHKFRNKLKNLNGKGFPIVPEDDTISTAELLIVLNDYLRYPNRLNGSLTKIQNLLALVNPVNPTEQPKPEANPVPKPEANLTLNPNPQPNLPTQPNPTLNHNPKPQPNPKLVSEPVNQELQPKITRPAGHNPVEWFTYVAYRFLNPLHQFIETKECTLFFAFALISVQSWQVGAAYMETVPEPSLVIAVVFSVFFELTGLLLTVKSARLGYLTGFSILSALVNLAHFEILEPVNQYLTGRLTGEQACYIFLLRLVFSVGLPFAIFSFNHQYYKNK